MGILEKASGKYLVQVYSGYAKLEDWQQASTKSGSRWRRVDDNLVSKRTPYTVLSLDDALTGLTIKARVKGDQSQEWEFAPAADPPPPTPAPTGFEIKNNPQKWLLRSSTIFLQDL